MHEKSINFESMLSDFKTFPLSASVASLIKSVIIWIGKLNFLVRTQSIVFLLQDFIFNLELPMTNYDGTLAVLKINFTRA